MDTNEIQLDHITVESLACLINSLCTWDDIVDDLTGRADTNTAISIFIYDTLCKLSENDRKKVLGLLGPQLDYIYTKYGLHHENARSNDSTVDLVPPFSRDVMVSASDSLAIILSILPSWATRHIADVQEAMYFHILHRDMSTVNRRTLAMPIFTTHFASKLLDVISFATEDKTSINSTTHEYLLKLLDFEPWVTNTMIPNNVPTLLFTHAYPNIVIKYVPLKHEYVQDWNEFNNVVNNLFENSQPEVYEDIIQLSNMWVRDDNQDSDLYAIVSKIDEIVELNKTL